MNTDESEIGRKRDTRVTYNFFFKSLFIFSVLSILILKRVLNGGEHGRKILWSRFVNQTVLSSPFEDRGALLDLYGPKC